jgi:hypothetical protein
VNVPDFPGVTGSGSLAVIRFHAASSAVGTSPVDLSNGFLNDNLGAEIAATSTGGSVCVRDKLVIIAPSVVTRDATNVATTSATLNGNLDSKGTADNVTVYFEWGLTASYGNVTTAETRTAIGPFSANLTGLIEGIPYHFRAVASGDGCPAYGYDATLTTGRRADTTAPVISAVDSSDITVSGSTITWTTNEEATSQVEYGLTEEYGSSSILDANLVNSHSVVLTDLEAGETYHYRVISKGCRQQRGGVGRRDLHHCRALWRWDADLGLVAYRRAWGRSRVGWCSLLPQIWPVTALEERANQNSRRAETSALSSIQYLPSDASVERRGLESLGAAIVSAVTDGFGPEVVGGVRFQVCEFEAEYPGAGEGLFGRLLQVGTGVRPPLK